MHQAMDLNSNINKLQQKINFVNSLGIEGFYDNIARYDNRFIIYIGILYYLHFRMFDVI